MSSGEPVVCRECGATMNAHAEKVSYSEHDAEALDADLGGVLERHLTCPECGASEARALGPPAAERQQGP